MDNINDNVKIARFKGSPWISHSINLPVLIIGAGGIGSWLTFFLARQNTEIHLFDFDTIEELNMAGQLFSTADIGKTKVEAVKNLCLDYSGITINTYNEKYTDQSISNNIVFCCPDNMKCREDAFNNWIKLVEKLPKEEQDKSIFINGGMTCETYISHFVTYNKIEEYKKYLFKDGEIEPLKCSYKATSHCGAAVASMMVSMFNNFLTNRYQYKEDMRELPYEVFIDLPFLGIEICK